MYIHTVTVYYAVVFSVTVKKVHHKHNMGIITSET